MGGQEQIWKNNNVFQFIKNHMRKKNPKQTPQNNITSTVACKMKKAAFSIRCPESETVSIASQSTSI